MEDLRHATCYSQSFYHSILMYSEICSNLIIYSWRWNVWSHVLGIVICLTGLSGATVIGHAHQRVIKVSIQHIHQRDIMFLQY